jgi:porin
MLILDVNPAEDPCSQRLFIQGMASGRRYRSIFWATICLALLNGSSAVYAQQTQPASAVAKTRSLHCQHPADPRRRHSGCIDEDFDWDESLAGEWNGLRTEMMEIGVTPTLSYAGVLQTNVAGGPHPIWSYAGQMTVAFTVDMERDFGFRGMSSYIGMSWGTGSNLGGSLDISSPLNTLYAPSFYLGELYLRQTWLKKNLTVAAGRMAPSNSFASLPVFNNYVNYGINPNPSSLGTNDVSFFGPPTGTEWGAQASYTITPSIEAVAGTFNTNTHSANGKDHGADFILQEGNKGALVIGEIDYLLQRPSSRGRPGLYTVGLLHSNNAFASLANEDSESSGYSGEYALGQQMVYRPDGPGSSRGATLWGAWTRSSKEVISRMPLFWGTGLSYQGLIPARPNDIVSAGFIDGRASKFIPVPSSEQLFEVNYQWRHSRYMTVMPQFEYVWKKGGSNPAGTAVAGIQLAVTL